MLLDCRADLNASLAKRLGHANHAASELCVCVIVALCDIFQNALDASHIKLGIIYFRELFLSHNAVNYIRKGVRCQLVLLGQTRSISQRFLALS